MTEAELAWAAGFFDGEGSVGIYPRIQYQKGVRYAGWRLTARLAGCRQASIGRFASIVGNGSVRCEGRRTRRDRRIWMWCSFNAHVETALRQLLPFLVVKREQVELAIEFRATVGNRGSRGTPPEVLSRQAEMADAMKAMKLVS